jgi:hypothetical protein
MLAGVTALACYFARGGEYLLLGKIGDIDRKTPFLRVSSSAGVLARVLH